VSEITSTDQISAMTSTELVRNEVDDRATTSQKSSRPHVTRFVSGALPSDSRIRSDDWVIGSGAVKREATSHDFALPAPNWSIFGDGQSVGCVFKDSAKSLIKNKLIGWHCIRPLPPFIISNILIINDNYSEVDGLPYRLPCQSHARLRVNVLSSRKKEDVILLVAFICNFSQRLDAMAPPRRG